MINTLDQFYVFLGAVYGGIIIGIWYDLLRLVRMTAKPRSWFNAVCDLLFWAGAALLFFLVMLDVDNAEFRVYTLAGAAIGFVLYMLGPSKLILRGFGPVARACGERGRKMISGIKAKRAMRKAERRARRDADGPGTDEDGEA
mgnify:CR=1 FL=1